MLFFKPDHAFIFIFFDTFYYTVNKDTCKEPLGMYTGAIAKSDVSCDHEHLPSDVPECGKCKNARYKVYQLPYGKYWCIDYSAVETASLDISFHYSTYVRNLEIERFGSVQMCSTIEIHTSITPGEYNVIVDNEAQPKQVFIFVYKQVIIHLFYCFFFCFFDWDLSMNVFVSNIFI